MVTSAVALAQPSAIQASVVRQQSIPTATFASPLTAATIVSPKAMPHASLLPLHLSASSFASTPQQLTAASTMPQHYAHSHSSSAPSLPALLLSGNHSAASILTSSLPNGLPRSGISLSFSPSSTNSYMPLSSAFDLTSSICRSKQRLARKAELARQSRKRKKSAIAHMADAIRQLKDENARLRQRLAQLGVNEPESSTSSSTRSKRKASYKANKAAHDEDKRRVAREEEEEMSEVEEQEDECPSELTNSSEDEDGDEVLPGAAELAALSPSSTPSSVASSLLSAASSIDLPLTSLIGKRGRT